MKLVHCADLHLDSPLRGLSAYEGAPADEIRLAARRALENLVELCLVERADVLLVAGDVYDGDWPDFQTGLFFVRQMTRLREAGVRVFIVHGNHDAESKLTKRLPLPSNVTTFSAKHPETHVVRDLDLAVHGQSFAHAAVFDDLAAGYPEPLPGLFNVGLLHTAVAGLPGHIAYAPCALTTLVNKGYEYWALGHVHQRTVLSERPLILYPGNLQGRHIRETGAKGCTVVTVEDGVIVSAEHRSVDVLRWAKTEVDATGCATTGQVMERIRTALASDISDAEGLPLAARIGVTGACAAHALISTGEAILAEIRAICTDLGEGRVWVEKVILDTRPEIERATLRDREDAIGELLRSIDGFAADAEARAEFRDALEPLLSRLPTEARIGLAGLFTDDSDLEPWLRAAEDLLVGNLDPEA